MIKICPPPCGSGEVVVRHINNRFTNTYHVHCGLCGRIGDSKVDTRGAVNAWNDGIENTPVVLTGNE